MSILKSNGPNVEVFDTSQSAFELVSVFPIFVLVFYLQDSYK